MKGPLQNAFLTKAVPLGLDMVVAGTGRRYQFLPPEHPAMQCIEDCLSSLRHKGQSCGPTVLYVGKLSYLLAFLCRLLYIRKLTISFIGKQ